MSTVIFTDFTSVTAYSDIADRSKDNQVRRGREFRVVSATGLHPYQLIEFAQTLQELGADQREVRNFSLRVENESGRSPHRLIAEWKVDLPAEVGT